jgi:hypothetical protein
MPTVADPDAELTPRISMVSRPGPGPASNDIPGIARVMSS